MIICADCEQEKPHYAKGSCKQCYMYRWRQENREKRLTYARRYRKENREKLLVYQRRWHQKNPQKVRAMEQRRYQKHRSKRLAYVSQWRQENREKDAALKHHWYKKNKNRWAIYIARRKARKAIVANTLTPEQIEFERKIGQATFPSKELHLHHLVPLSKGGGHTWGNIAFIPVLLNLSIRDRLPEEVYRQVTLL